MICSALELDDTKFTRSVADKLVGIESCLEKTRLRSYTFSKTQKIFSKGNIKWMEFCKAVMDKRMARKKSSLMFFFMNK